MSDRQQQLIGAGWFNLTPESMAGVLGFPVGCRVTRMDRHIETDDFQVRVEGPGLPPVLEGFPVPRINPTYTATQVREGEVAPSDVYSVALVSW